MLMFLICILKGLHLIVTVCDGLLMFFLVFFSTPFLVIHFSKATVFGFLDRTAISIEPSKLMKKS